MAGKVQTHRPQEARHEPSRKKKRAKSAGEAAPARSDSVQLSSRARGEGTSPRRRAQEKAVRKAVRTGESVRFPSRHGHSANVRLEAPQRENGTTVYRGMVDGLPVELRLPPGKNSPAALARAVDRQTATRSERRDMETVARALETGEGGTIRGADGKPLRIGSVDRGLVGGNRHSVEIGGRTVPVGGGDVQSLRSLARNVRQAGADEKTRLDSASEALRTGRPVPFRSSNGHEEELLLRRVDRPDGTKGYEAVLGGVNFPLETPRGANRRDLIREIDSKTARAKDQAQVDQVRQGLESGQPVEFRPKVGDPMQVQLRQLPSSDGKVRYAAVVDGHEVQIAMPEANGRSLRALTRMLDFYGETPEHHRFAVRELTVETGPRADEAEWRQRLGLPPTSQIAADAGGGRIRFFRDAQHLGRSVFNHEMGHIVGRTANWAEDPLGGGRVSMPRAWPDAIAGDRRPVSEYGDTAPVEDFAEAWDAYVTARRRGPEEVEALRRRYPNRIAILEPLYAALPPLEWGVRA